MKTSRFDLLRNMLTRQKNTNYKGLILNEHCNGTVVEMNISDNCINDSISCIHSISYLVEFISMHRGIRYLIFNKLNTDFEIDTALYGFFKSNVFPQLRASGVLKSLYVVSQHQYDKLYHDCHEREPFMRGFLTMEDALEWIQSTQTIHV